MAQGVGFSIDASFLNKIEQADKAFKKLADTNDTVVKNISNTWKQIGEQGLDSYLRSLEKQKKVLADIASIKFDDSAPYYLKKFGENAKSSVAEIDKLIQTLTTLQQATPKQQAIEKARQEAYDIVARAYAKTGGKDWSLTGEVALREYQAQLEAMRRYVAERKAMYAQMFDEIDAKERKQQADYSNYRQQQLNDELTQYRKNKEAQAAIDKRNHDRKQRELEELFRLQTQHEERLRKRQQSLYNATGDSSQGALNYANRLFSGSKPMTLNNMQTALSKLQDAQRKLNLDTDAGKQKYEQLAAMIKRVQQRINEATGASEKLKNSHNSLINTGDQLMRKLALVFSVSQIQGYINKLVQVRGEFELQQRALQSILQNKDEANKIWQQTVDLAVRSPYRVGELVKYTKQLAAYRIETDQLHETTKRLADVSAGLGVDMNRLILAYGQVRAAEYLRGTELRQFTEAGIPMLDELAKHFTALEGRAVSAGDVFGRISKRMVAFEDVAAVFQKMTDAGGVFYNMQEIQAETLKGQISNLHDSIDLMLNDIGKANDVTLKGLIEYARNLVDNWEEISFSIEKAIIAYAAIKSSMWIYSKGMNNAANTTLWFNSTLKTKIGTTMADVKTMTLQEARILGVTKAQFALGKATMFLQGALRGVGILLKSALPFLLIGGVIELWRSMTEASRAAKRLKDELDGLISADVSTLDKNSDAFKDLVARLDDANKGSQEHSDIIKKLNSQYGEYLNFVVDESTTMQQLADAYDEVVKRMKEKQSLATFEKGMATIAESYGNNLKEAKDEFYDLFNAGAIKSTDNNFISITASKKEIDDIYSLVQQKSRELKSEEIDSLAEQRKIINDIIKEYYGKEYFLSVDATQGILLMDILLKKKKQEEELQKEIDAQYKETLKSREANLAKESLQIEYAQKRRNIEKTAKTDFERASRLYALQTEERLAIIDLKLKFNLISPEDAKDQKDKIINWATELNKSINDAIYKDVAKIDTEELNEISNSMKSIGKEMEDSFHGNVDLLHREIIPAAKLAEKGWKDVGDGIATVFSSQYRFTDEKGESFDILVTPILPDGSVLSQEELESYVDNTLAGAEDILKADTLGLVIGVDVDPDGTAGEKLHLLQEQYYNLSEKRKELFKEFSEADLSKVLINKELQDSKSTEEYVNKIKTAWEQQTNIISELISFKSEGLKIDEKQLEKAEHLEKMYRLTADAIGLELKYTERLSEESRNAINALLPDKYKISLEEAYSGIDKILSGLKTKEKEHLAVIQQLNEQKKNGLPIDEEKLRIAEESYWWVKKTQDLVDPSAKTAIAEQKVLEINAKLEEKYKINSIDKAKDEVTLLQEANSEKEKAIAYEAQLKAQRAKGITVTDKALEQAKKEVEQTTLRWQLLGGIEKEKAKSSRTNSLYDERIKVIDDMRKKYEDVIQKFGEDTAIEEAFDAYKDAFVKAFEGVSFIPSNVDQMTAEEFVEQVLAFPDKNAIVEFLDTLAEEPMKAFEKIKVELAKGKYVFEMKIEAKAEENKQIAEQIQNMFGDYEMSLELEKLNIPPDFAKNIFGVDTIDLSDIRKKIESEISRAEATGGEKEFIEQRKQDLKKVDELERKAQEERLKKYVQYGRETTDKRVKIKIAELNHIAEIEKAFAIKEGDSEETKVLKEKERIRAESVARQQAREELKKIEWEEFRSSDTFNMIFDDLENAGDTALNLVIKKLKEFKEQWTDMPFDQMRQVVDLLQKAEEAQKVEDKSRDERKRLRKAISVDGRSKEEAISDLSDAEEEIQNQNELLAKYEQFRQLKEGLLKVDTLTKEEQKEYTEWLNKGEQEQNALINTAKDARDEAERAAKAAKDQLNNITKLDNEYKKQAEQTGKIKQMANDVYGSFKDLAEVLVDTEDGVGGIAALFADAGMSMANSVLDAIMLQAELKAVEVQAGTTAAKINTAMGVIGWIVMAIQLLTTALKAAFDVHDKGLQREIDSLADSVERLENDFERIEKQIEHTFTGDEAMHQYERATANIERRIAANQKMRALEEEKKKKDKSAIKGYTDAIDDLEEELVELQEQKLIDFGGLGGDYKSVAEDFIDAWYDAFQETGDGIKGLEESFDELLQNVVKKQMLMRGMEGLLRPVLQAVDAAVNDSYVTEKEWDEILKAFEDSKNPINEYLKGIYELFGMTSSGELSELQKGIQSITKPQAAAIEAYLNSMRFFVSDSNSILKNIHNSINVSTSTPIMSELKAQTQLIRTIDENLSSVIGRSSTAHQGAYIKVLAK